jgi:hypothetical protein
VLEAFIQRYRATFYAEIARARIGELKASNTEASPQVAVIAPTTQAYTAPARPDQAVGIRQRAVLYDEDPGDSKGEQYVGTVIWRTEPVKATADQKPEIAVRADIEIPDRKFKMTIVPPQHRQFAAGEPHRRNDLQPAAGFFRRRRRQRTGHPDEVQ